MDKVVRKLTLQTVCSGIYLSLIAKCSSCLNYRPSFLRNYDGDSEDNVASEMNLHFKYEPHGTWLKSFTLFFSVETIAKVNFEHSDKFETEINKIGSS